MNILDNIVEPVSFENPVGVLLAEDDRLNFIDDEMMKVGSLSHSSVAWDKVQITCLNLLHKDTKDIKILSNLLQCLQQDADLESVLVSIEVFSAFVGKYWLDAYPVPGSKGNGIRSRFYKQIMQRNIKAIKKIEQLTVDPKRLDEVVNGLELCLQTAGLDLELLFQLQVAVNSLKNYEQEELLSTPTDATDKEQEQTVALAPDAPKVYFDPKNERATRQALFTMSSFLNTANPSASIGYRVRRNALWFSIWHLPTAKKDHVTELAGYSTDRYSQYCSSVEQQPCLELLIKLERSIEQNPYWLDGHHLSYQLSNKLGYKSVAEAIHQEIQDFVARFPQILELKAQNSSPFANLATIEWINQSLKTKDATVSVVSIQHSWQEEYQHLIALCNEQGLAVALGHINSQLQKAVNVRDQHYWRLLSADLLYQQQLPALAKNEYQVLLHSISSMSIDDWEGSFSGQIIQSLETIDNLGL